MEAYLLGGNTNSLVINYMYNSRHSIYVLVQNILKILYF